jgi:uncharacterized LabA/DUF88 family protein
MAEADRGARDLMARLDVFIDGSNFSIACRNFLGRYVNPKALARTLAQKCSHQLGETFYYDCPSPSAEVQRRKQRFWADIEKARVTLRMGRLESNYNGTHREKECDVMIAVDMVVRACDGSYDRAMLVSADTDLAHAVEVAQQRGREVAWAYLPTQEHIDRFKQIIPLNLRLELTEKILRPIQQ